jgi:dolichyl-phosphate mannosyltransferase polypeptide 2 regulatory subunit
MRDRTFGALALAALTLAFVYYTLWLLVVPLVDDGHPALALFPRPELAVAFSAHLGAGVVCLSVFIVGAAMIVHRPRKEEKRA